MLGCPSSIEFHPVTRGECRFLFSPRYNQEIFYAAASILLFLLPLLPFALIFWKIPNQSGWEKRREQNNKKRVTFWVALLMAGSFLDGIMGQWGNSAASRQLCLVVVVLPDFATTANNPSRGGSCCLPICGSHARYFRPERLQSPQWREISFAFPSR